MTLYSIQKNIYYVLSNIAILKENRISSKIKYFIRFKHLWSGGATWKEFKNFHFQTTNVNIEESGQQNFRGRIIWYDSITTFSVVCLSSFLWIY